MLRQSTMENLGGRLQAKETCEDFQECQETYEEVCGNLLCFQQKHSWNGLDLRQTIWNAYC